MGVDPEGVAVFQISNRGDTRNLERFLKKFRRGNLEGMLQNFGEEGVELLASVTPVDTGLTARSWKYELTSDAGVYSLAWYNTNESDGTPIVILLQYGHGTKGGNWVEGRDFINPAILPFFDKMADDVWREVTSG